MTSRDQSRPAATGRDTSRGAEREVAAAIFDETRVYEHPYVLRLERQIDKLEQKLDDQIRRTELIQTASQERLLELQRMTAVGQSQTLANFMLKARDWFGGSTTKDKVEGSDALENPSEPSA